MSDDFITIREATKITDKADITIRRLIKQLIKQNNPEATQMIKQEQQGQGRGFIYKINKDYLLKELKISEPVKETEQKEKKEFPKSREKTGKTETPEIVREVIKTLKSQIYIKDKQIDSLSGKIDQLIERDRETNIILKGLQDRVFLLEGAKIRQNEAEMDKEPQKAEKEPTNEPTSKKQANKTEIKEKSKKKGFFSRLFSKGDTP